MDHLLSECECELSIDCNSVDSVGNKTDNNNNTRRLAHDSSLFKCL